MSLIHRAGTALLTAALAVAVVPGAPSHAAGASRAPAGDGAHWLAGQLRHGVMHNGQFDFDDYGLTADTALALEAIGHHGTALKKIRHALARHVDDYTTYRTDRYAGSIAKLLVVAQQTGGDPTKFGGVDLVRRLEKRVATKAPIAGRIEDKSSSGDFANTIGQIFTARGLLKAGSASGGPALRFLLKQQCDNGAFRLDFNANKTAAVQGCTKSSDADTDVTALAVIELSWLRQAHPSLKAALKSAVRWLRKHQARNGSFGGGGPTSAANANSTGLAGWAFIVSGRCGPEHDAAVWVHRHQVRGDVSGTPLAGERGAIAYDRSAMKAARHDGITKSTRDQWRRATAQAAPALLALHSCIAA
ncbi:MAG: prenyltransferase/squalene oxidase repeat-containing protein [Nocardioides sp.]